MRSTFAITTILLLLLTSCAGGDNLAQDTAVDIQLTVAELRNFDEDLRADDIGKVGQTTGIVMSSKRAAPNEKEMGSYFIQIYTEKVPGEQFDPQISCYTWGNPGLKKGSLVTLKGNIGRGAAMGHALLNCYVERK